MSRTIRFIVLLAAIIFFPSLLSAQELWLPNVLPFDSPESLNAFSSIGTLEEGLFFSDTRRIIPGDSKSEAITLGLNYNGVIGVQGLQFTIESPNRFLRFKKVEFGEGMQQTEGWFLDYQITNTLSGSELRVIAFGRDTTYNIGAGTHDKLFRITFDVLNAGTHNGVIGSDDNTTGVIYLSKVESALAHSLGYSAGVQPSRGRDSARFTISSVTSRDESRCRDYASDHSVRKVSSSLIGAEKFAEMSLLCTPNPCSETISIHYALSAAVPVTVVIGDARGVEVARPVDGERQEGGEKTLRFDTSFLSNGVYLCTVTAGENVQMQKLVVVR